MSLLVWLKKAFSLNIMYFAFTVLFILYMISSFKISGILWYESLKKLTARLIGFAILWNADCIYVVFSTGSTATKTVA